MRKFYSLIAIAIVFFYSCKSASKLYEQGNYKDAMDVAIKKLQKDPNDYEYRDVMKKSYAYAVSQHEDRIRILANGSNENKYELIYGEYNQLQSLYDKIRRYPSISQLVKPTDYSSYVQTYKDKAGDVHVEKAMHWMEEETKPSYREAYKEYRAALYYKPNDIDIKRKMQDAYDLALVKILLIPVDAFNSNYYYSNSSSQNRNFMDKMIRNLNYNSGSEFVKYYTEAEARGNKIEPDEVVELRMGRMNFGQPYDQNSARKVSKEVVIKERVYNKDSVVKEYGKVYATITTTKRALISEADMYITARDKGGKIIWSDNFRGEHRWQIEFATYTGDERALSDSDKNLLDKKETKVPREEEIADYLLQKIENDLSDKLRNYYSRYQ